MRVHQVLSGAGPFDAVANQALAFRGRFSAWGWRGTDVAAAIDPRARGAFSPLGALEAGPQDTVLLHYSAHAPGLRAVLDQPGRTVLLSHNVTPARWFWDHDPRTAVQCELGRRELGWLAERCDVVAGVSAFNAAELGAHLVVPILFDPAPLGPPRAGAPAPPALLFVGRLAPHKRQDELIRLVAHLRANGVPDATLTLVGEPVTPGFLAELERLARDVAPGAVAFKRGLTPAQLAAEYAAAALFVCLSEHEGFCIPLLEAFHAGLPVVARPAGAIPEVAGDAALLVADRDLAVVAELCRVVLEEPALRATLRERGAARVAHYAPGPVAAQLRALLEPAGARPGPGF